MFLKLDGIDGESATKGYEKWIEVDSFAFGATHSIQTGSTGIESGKTELSPVSITKAVDSSSPQKFTAPVGGKHIATGILDLVNAGPDPQKFFEYTFSDIVLASLSFGLQGDRPTEPLTFDYSKIKLQAFTIDPQGHSVGLPPVEFSLNGLAPAPEPSTWALLLGGLLAIGMRGRKLLQGRIERRASL